MTRDSRHLSDAAQFARILRDLQTDLQQLKEGDRSDPDIAQLIRTLDHEIDAHAPYVEVGLYDPSDFSNYDSLSDAEILAEAESITPTESWRAEDQALIPDASRAWTAAQLAPDASHDPAQLMAFGDGDPTTHAADDDTLANRFAASPIVYDGTVSASHGLYGDDNDTYRAVLYTVIDPGEFGGRDLTELAVTTQNEATGLLLSGLARPDGTTHTAGDTAAVIVRADLGYRSSDAADRTTTQRCHRIPGLRAIPTSEPAPIQDGAVGRELYADSAIHADLRTLRAKLGSAPVADWDRTENELRLLVYLDSAHFVDETLREVGLESEQGVLLSYGPVEPTVEKTGLETVSLNIDLRVV